MHIAILMTNTDDSAFSQAHPKDGQKFIRLLAPLRPDWRFTVHAVKDGVFPETLDGIDAALITGSPASVHDDAAWIPRLLDLIRQMVADGLPLFGACFGHQAIALALGGTVGPNPGGWVLGLVDSDLDGPIRLYAAHTEQVTRLPAGAETVGATQGCPIAAFRIGPRVLTTQYHPEMTPDFIAALVDHLDGALPDAVIATARASLTQRADTARIAARMISFFETAQDSAASKSIAVT